MEVLTEEMIRRLKFDRVTGTDLSCFGTEAKGTKKAQEIEPKSNTFSIP
jgi:hypothetical protein